MYSHHDGQIWRHEAVNQEGLGSRNPSIDLADDGTPHFVTTVISLELSWALMYITLDGDEWVTEMVGIDDELVDANVVPPDDKMGDFATLRVDGEGIPHIGYSNNELASYARRVDGEWEMYEVENTLQYGAINPWVNITLDSDGIPHFAYEADGLVRYATLKHQEGE